jgi:uncharacterized lipoprotein YmbA
MLSRTMRRLLLVGAILLSGCGTAMHKTAYADRCVADAMLVAATDNGRYVAVRSADPAITPNDVWLDRETCAEVQ